MISAKQALDRLRHGLEILERLIEEERLRIVGAKYALKTGAVEFL